MAKLKDSYADALFEVSEENGTLERDLEQAILVRDTLKSSDVQAFLLHQYVPDSAKRQLFHKAFSEKIAWHLMGFLYLMVRNKRESLIMPTLTEYIDRINRRFGKIEAKVVSAKALTEEQIESIRIALAKKIDMQNMQVEIKAAVDPDVIGGFYVLIDGRIFDRTLRSDLNNMKERLRLKREEVVNDN
ncbi:MAG: ATP synthase F1 subunit delta [Firmicutes bacterium]|nr:ATP synthase F1 subunit delta [Bacillota bacterium]